MMTSLKEACDVLGAYARDEKNRHLDVQARIAAADNLAAALITASKTFSDLETTKASLESENARLISANEGLVQSSRKLQVEFDQIKHQRDQRQAKFDADFGELDKQIEAKKQTLAALETSLEDPIGRITTRA